MATRATQLRIMQTALELFNEHGTAAVSSTRVAERCGISKGNLQYHFPNKRDIIDALFQQAIQEMDSGWYRDHLAPTLEHMAAMYVRQSSDHAGGSRQERSEREVELLHGRSPCPGSGDLSPRDESARPVRAC